MSRTPESLLHEADYWQHALTDIKELNDLIVKAARPLPDVSIELLSLALGDDPVRVSDHVGDLVNESLAALAAMDEPVCRLIELVTGRLVAMRGEFEEVTA